MGKIYGCEWKPEENEIQKAADLLTLVETNNGIWFQSYTWVDAHTHSCYVSFLIGMKEEEKDLDVEILKRLYNLFSWKEIELSEIYEQKLLSSFPDQLASTPDLYYLRTLIFNLCILNTSRLYWESIEEQ